MPQQPMYSIPPPNQAACARGLPRGPPPHTPFGGNGATWARPLPFTGPLAGQASQVLIVRSLAWLSGMRDSTLRFACRIASLQLYSSLRVVKSASMQWNALPTGPPPSHRGSLQPPSGPPPSAPPQFVGPPGHMQQVHHTTHNHQNHLQNLPGIAFNEGK